MKVTIICPEHGEFNQIPSDHLNGAGCPYCHQPSRHPTIKKFKKVDPKAYNKAKKMGWLGDLIKEFKKK